jgi:hypothetical protein
MRQKLLVIFPHYSSKEFYRTGQDETVLTFLLLLLSSTVLTIDIVLNRQIYGTHHLPTSSCSGPKTTQSGQQGRQAGKSGRPTRQKGLPALFWVFSFDMGPIAWFCSCYMYLLFHVDFVLTDTP